MGDDASSFLSLPLRSGLVNTSNVWLGTTQGNCTYDVDTSMPKEDFFQLQAAVERADIRKSAIVVCHRWLPVSWSCSPPPVLS